MVCFAGTVHWKRNRLLDWAELDCLVWWESDSCSFVACWKCSTHLCWTENELLNHSDFKWKNKNGLHRFQLVHSGSSCWERICTFQSKRLTFTFLPLIYTFGSPFNLILTNKTRTISIEFSFFSLFNLITKWTFPEQVLSMSSSAIKLLWQKRIKDGNT